MTHVSGLPSTMFPLEGIEYKLVDTNDDCRLSAG
eukprot:SAG11_NODE_31338_length_292_cov_1.808290_1_plen_33_part_01